jgi:transposase
VAKPYSNDLRHKFLQAYDQGKASLNELAVQHGVSPGWAKKISVRHTRRGQIDFVPDQRAPTSQVTPEVEQWLRTQIREQPDLTLAELQEKLAREWKVQLSVARLWWALKDLGLRLKKSRSTAREQKTADAQQRRQAWKEEIQALGPSRLVFLDESGVTTQMTAIMDALPSRVETVAPNWLLWCFGLFGST